MLIRRHGLTRHLSPWLGHPARTSRPAAILPLLHHSYTTTTTSSPGPGHDIAVLGGGITGLAAAYYLHKSFPTSRITVLEASSRIGGWLSSKRVPVPSGGDVLFEAGPRTLRPAGNGVLTAQILQELDLAKDTIFAQKTSPAAQYRYVYYPDHLVRMPHPAFGVAENLWSLLTEPVFRGVIGGAAGEFFRKPRVAGVEDESVAEFLGRRFSPVVVERLVSAVLHGIYAGDVNRLSARSLFAGIWRDEVVHDSVVAGMVRKRAEGLEVTLREAEFVQKMENFRWDPLLRATLKDNNVFTFKDGLSMLSDALARHLLGVGNVEFSTNKPIRSVVLADGGRTVDVKLQGEEEARSFSHVVSTLSPYHLGEVLKSGETTKASVAFPSIPAVTVMTVNLYYRTPDLNPPGFGYLIPQATSFEQNPERALGVVFDTAYSPSPKDLDLNNWQVTDTQQLIEARDKGQLINVNDFAWYNMPDRPHVQDTVSVRGTKLTVMLGGHWWNDWPAFPSEEEGLALAKSVVERHLGITEEPEVWQVNLQKDCIPQYNVGHHAKLKAAHNAAKSQFNGRLRLAGSYIAGPGVNDCIRSAWDAAQSLERTPNGTGLEYLESNEYVTMKPVRVGEKEE